MSTFWDLSYAGTTVPEKSRFLRLHRAPSDKSHGTVVVLHGGYWKNKFGLDDANSPQICFSFFFYDLKTS